MPDDEKKNEPTPDEATAEPAAAARRRRSLRPPSRRRTSSAPRPSPRASTRIGEETEIDRIAREEEQKLLERKKGKKGKKGGLEAAASKRLAKIGEGKVKRPSVDGGRRASTPDADPLLERTARAHASGSGSTGRRSAAWSSWGCSGSAASSAAPTGRRSTRPTPRRSSRRRSPTSTGTSRTRPTTRTTRRSPRELYPTFKTVGDAPRRRARQVPRGRDEVRRAPARRSSRAWPRRGCCSTRATRRARSRRTTT